MEDLSALKNSGREPLRIRAVPYLRDHRLMERAVLPAVESLQALAARAAGHLPRTRGRVMRDAIFSRFLEIHPHDEFIEASSEITVAGKGDVKARLISTRRLHSGIGRTMEHAAVWFSDADEKPAPPAFDLASSLEGICFALDAARLYEELVPFGPAYRNAEGTIYLSGDGALCRVKSPSFEALPGPLGSPFPMDAALHCACAWGQRYAGISSLPTGFDERLILSPTERGGSYWCRVFPVSSDGETLLFDIWILDEEGELRETARGVRMWDAAGLKPPDWIRPGAEPVLINLTNRCKAASVVELGALAPFAHRSFSPRERERSSSMGAKRMRSFTGARLACKRLARRLAGGDSSLSAEAIETLDEEGIRPRCDGGGSPGLCCSVSHDGRFAVAVASDRRIGIDVEPLSERVLKSRHLYMSEEEQEIARSFPLGPVEGALRVWSIKEAAAKALDLHLAESWRAVEVRSLGVHESHARLGGRPAAVFHDTVEDHLFTLCELEGDTF